MRRSGATLDGRPVESLIDLPLMTDPELQAAMRLCSDLAGVAYFTDLHLMCLLACRMVNISMQHGMSDASPHAYGCWTFLGLVFHRYGEGYRFAKVGCDLVEKHNFIAHKAKVYLLRRRNRCLLDFAASIASAIDFTRTGIRTAIGDRGSDLQACYGIAAIIGTELLLQGNPLDALWHESESGLDFLRKARYRDMAGLIESQQRFIATMQGRTTTFSTFSDAQFDEAIFEAQLTGEPGPVVVCWYWLAKLKARFLAGDYVAALAAAQLAQPIVSASFGLLPWFDYFYYTALTVAALYQNGSANEQAGWRELLTAHREQLREWADNNPPTFGDKHALVSAEIARLEKRDADALQLYEQAIHLAREHSFVQNEGLAHELAACQSLLGARSGNGGPRPSSHCAELLRPLGCARQGAAVRPFVSAPQGGKVHSRHHAHDRGAGRTPGSRYRYQSLASSFGRDRPGETDRHTDAHSD